ncbi:hypothetical protein OPV22_000194 [Ensete ventricosum]|uniref:NAB domain-containing protein n=1 Tax=Ensete ventricosum TaxID=4639 RepID=A0AAV8RNV3_ENSVE|nr:hypothetical protein OPV22_000194 [Ensete ventricosum]
MICPVRTTTQQQLPQSWWFGSLKGVNSSRQSPWLISTLAELDDKTKQMLRLVEDDADTFAERAEMYYKKRPQLVSMIEDFRRAHSSLAVRYDQLKSGGAARRVAAPCRLDRSWARSISSNKGEVEPRNSASDSSSSEEDDPEQGGERRRRETPDADLGTLMMGEVERLKEENAALKSEIAGKDEEKRDVIRQLALSLQILTEERAGLRMYIKDGKKKKKKGAISEFGKLIRKLFGWQ